jgi:transcriptional regulator with XRE-family HTH domain
VFTVVPPTNIAADPAGYDPARLARILRRHRRQHQRSTRELASRAGVSQAYVVALERNSVDIPPPTPTVEVLVRLAAAMDRDPLDLFAACLRVRSRHVVLVTDVVTDETLAQAVGASGADECAWVWASSGASVPTAARHRIDLRRTAGTSYRPARIRQALQRELEHLGDLRDEELGFVFAETSAVMDSLDDPSVLLEFEQHWGQVVDDAAQRVGADAAWNVCVYELDRVRHLPDPVKAVVDLIRCHDDIWSGDGASVLVGGAATREVLRSLRPTGVRSAGWRSHVDHLVGELHGVA